MIPTPTTRRAFLRDTALLSASAACLASPALRAASGQPVRLFDGKTLAGWRAIPRLTIPQEFGKTPAAELKAAVMKWHEARPESAARLKHTGSWTVVDGALVGRPDPEDSDLGAYLISERTFGDFELELEARPDWFVDTGFMVRAHELGGIGFQILVDHRPRGGIGGVFGNNIGQFLGAPVVVDGDADSNFKVSNLRPGQREPQFKVPPLDYGATFEDFKKCWRANDWNHFRVRCTGRIPKITTWVNGVKFCELDAAKLVPPTFDPELIARRIGPTGHLAFEVHDINRNNPIGQSRWGRGAVCRWRNVFVQEL